MRRKLMYRTHAASAAHHSQLALFTEGSRFAMHGFRVRRNVRRVGEEPYTEAVDWEGV